MIEHNNLIPKPPFYGSRCIERISLSTIVPYINLKILAKLWGMQQSSQEKIKVILHRLIAESQQKNSIQPKAVYGYFACQSEKDTFIVYTDFKGQNEACRFLFPRQKIGNHVCLADYFRSKSSQKIDVVAFQLVTAGQQASDYSKELFLQNKYQEYLYWRGLNAAIAGALAEFVHKHIRIELGFISEEPSNIDDIFKQKYRGKRFSFGYPACPNLEDQEKILKLLSAEQIGISLSETFQLLPEESTSAMVIHHPQATRF